MNTNTEGEWTVVPELAQRLKQRNREAGREAGHPAPISATSPALTEGFPGGRVVTTCEGTYCLITRHYPHERPLDTPASNLLENLQLLYGVGPVGEAGLRQQGKTTLADLLDHPKWGSQAERLLTALGNRDVRFLKSCGARWEELLNLFAGHEIAFLDIETTGLYHTLPLFLVGLLFWRGGQFILHQYLARSFEEESPALEEAASQLRDFPVVVTYNGSTFDLPYLKGRLASYRREFASPPLHVDLLPWVRHNYAGLLPDCRLATVERYILGFSRVDDVPGHMVPEIYHRFVQEQNPAILEGVLLHNARDLLSLAKVLSFAACGFQPQARENSGRR